MLDNDDEKSRDNNLVDDDAHQLNVCDGILLMQNYFVVTRHSQLAMQS